MFKDTNIEILNPDNLNQVIKTIDGDVQPYQKSITFEDGYVIDISIRAFCDKDALIDLNSYLGIGGSIYKVMELKEWSDYLTLSLYQCKSGIGGGE